MVKAKPVVHRGVVVPLFVMSIAAILSCEGLEDGKLIAPALFGSLGETVHLEASPGMVVQEGGNSGATWIRCSQQGRIAHLEVYVDLVHGDLDDIVVQLASPQGTSVYLHYFDHSSRDQGYYSTSDIAAWYEREMPCHTNGDLQAFRGELSSGFWTIRVYNYDEYWDATLYEWRLDITLHD
ncbi:MAG: proprotein convertase P-domain-containing protein [Candidatus Eisenbacteria bacterium]